MTLSDSLLLGMVAILAINYAATRLPGWHHRFYLFWGAQIINLIAGSYVFYFGIPDFSAQLDVVNYLIGLLFFYHVVENNIRWQKFQQKEKRILIEEERKLMEENIRQYRKEEDKKKQDQQTSQIQSDTESNTNHNHSTKS